MSAQDQVFRNNSVAMRTSQEMMKELRGKIRNEEEYASTSVKWLVMIATKALDAFYYEGEDERNVIQFLMSDHSVFSVVQEAGIVTEVTDGCLCPKF